MDEAFGARKREPIHTHLRLSLLFFSRAHVCAASTTIEVLSVSGLKLRQVRPTDREAV
jgi:hypothetical protein